MTSRMLNVFNRRCPRDIIVVSRKDCMTNKQLLLSAGVEDLQDIIATAKKIYWTCIAPPDEISQPSNRLNSRWRK